MSMAEYRRRFAQPTKPDQAKPEKASKFKNQKMVIDGFKFDSKKEGKRYCDLKILQRAGQIHDLQMQVSFELMVGVKFENEKRKKPDMRYIADFTYMQGGLKIVEDVKSCATRRLPAYRQKKHLMKSVHNIEIQEF